MKLAATVSLPWFLDGNTERGNLGLKHFEADHQFLILDTIHYFAERALYTSQNGGNERGIKHDPVPHFRRNRSPKPKASATTVAPGSH